MGVGARAGSAWRLGTKAAQRAGALAVVAGGWDVVRPLVLAGVPSAAWVPPHQAIRFSRHLAAGPTWWDPWLEPKAAVEELLDFGRRQPEPPVLLPTSDATLVLLVHHEQTLSTAYRVAVGAPALVEQIVDKASFHRLATRLRLPVPPTRRVRPFEQPPDDVDLEFPIVVKPVRQSLAWQPEGGAKAIRVDSPAALRSLWPQLAAARADVLAQQEIAGLEDRIESYHAYRSTTGAVLGEFTGRKLRTLPARYGESTAVEITAAEDVARLGREILVALGLNGAAKVDFKRSPDGGLTLLEVNPRFNLWNHPGAIAGVNLPALAWQEACGTDPSLAPRAQPGVCWCDPIMDLRAARVAGEPLSAWLGFLHRCDAVSDFALDDPLPFVRGRLARRLETVLRRSGGAVLERARR